MSHARLLRCAIAPLAVTAALGLAGCGGDDEDTIALADWLTQADQICAEADEDLDQEIATFFADTQEPSPEQVEELATDILVPSLQSQHDELSDLPEPDESADEVDETLDTLQAGIDELEADPSLAATPDGPPEIAEATEMAKDLGLEDCGAE